VLYQALREVAESRLDQPAIRDLVGSEDLTYGDLGALVDRIAGGLRDVGVDSGAVVACSMSNSVGYIAFIFAVTRIGATYVPLIREFDADDVADALRWAEPALLVVDRSRPPVATECPTIELRELVQARPVVDRTHPFRGRFRLLWTSGSTGRAKMISWRQESLYAERTRWARHIGLTPDDVVFCRHPLDVAHATDLHMFSALLVGGVLVLADPTASDDTLLRQLDDTGATVLSALPEHYLGLARAASSTGGVRLPALRLPMCGGTYVSPDVVAEAASMLGVHLRQLYGSTEFGLAAVNLADLEQRSGEVYLVDGVTARLAPVADGDADIGELVLRSSATSDGYVNDDDAQRRTFRSGEYWTGDIARRSNDGAYRVLGRVSEALAAKDGPLLAPVLDEQITRECRAAESVSLADDPECHSNRTTVVVVPRPGTTAEELECLARAVLDQHGLTGQVHVVDSIPRTAVGKPHKALLRRRWVRDRSSAAAATEPVRFTRHGAHPSLVFLHGWGTTGRFFDRVVADLERDHDVVTVDMRGHGVSPAAEPGWTLTQAAEDLRHVLERLRLSGVTLVGWSLGAGVAYTYLERYDTDLVSKLVSVEMSPRLLTEAGWEHGAFGGLDAAGALETSRRLWADPDNFRTDLVKQFFADGRQPDAATLRELVAQAETCHVPSMMGLWSDALTHDWRDQLRRLTIPTLLVHGGRSQVFPTKVGEWLLDAIPTARLEVFAHSGHLPFIEEAEKFAAIVRTFVSSSSELVG
jgi:acyl-coenzyme A synthetase/AMP-(fatty) acid ligase/alpha-beta hydrolase superfamily lysophospholipase